MEVVGKIKEIFSTEEVGSNNFKKRDIVLTTDEQYPQHLLIQFTQDKTSLLDHYQVGQDVTIRINLRGREWINPEGETKYFNTIQGWNIKYTNGQGNNNSTSPRTPQPTQQQHAGDEFLSMGNDPTDDDDDLPF